MAQNIYYLVFIPAKKYIKYFSGTTWVNSLKFHKISEENIENKTKSGSFFALSFVDHHVLPDINFNGHCLINDNISVSKKVIIVYISYILNQWPRHLNTDFTLGSWLFGSVRLTKNADLDRHKYSNYGHGFNSGSEFLFTDGNIGKNIFRFGADLSSSVHIDNKNKDILIIEEGPT